MKNYIIVNPARLYMFAVTLFAIAVACVVSTMDYEAEARQAQLHCDMVALFEKSDGQAGWPDYNNTKETCDD